MEEISMLVLMITCGVFFSTCFACIAANQETYQGTMVVFILLTCLLTGGAVSYVEHERAVLSAQLLKTDLVLEDLKALCVRAGVGRFVPVETVKSTRFELYLPAEAVVDVASQAAPVDVGVASNALLK